MPKLTQWNGSGWVDVATGIAESGGGSGVSETDWEERNYAALKRWREALGNAHVSRADLYVMGDSNSEGGFISTMNARWASLVRERLQSSYNPEGTPGGEGFVNPRTIGMGTTDRWTYTGTVTLPSPGTQDPYNFGLGGRYAWLDAAGESASLSFYGNQVHIFYTQGSGTGNMSISIDGGAAVTVNTNGTPTTSGKFWSSPALTRGQHTVTVSWVSGIVVVDGALVNDGDSATGVRLWDASRSGYTAAMAWPGNWVNYMSSSSLGPDLVLLSYGPNEISAGISAATFETDLGALVDRIKTQQPLTSIAIQMFPKRVYNNNTDLEFQAYVDAAERVALAKSTAFFDFSQAFPVSLNSATLGSSLGAGSPSGPLYYDQVHYSDAGHRAVADLVLERIAPQAIPQKNLNLDKNQIIGGLKTFSNSVYLQTGATSDGNIGTSQTMWADGGFFENGQRVYSPSNLPPAPSNMVTTDTFQDIPAAKQFNSTVSLSSTSFLTGPGAPINSPNLIFYGKRWTTQQDVIQSSIYFDANLYQIRATGSFRAEALYDKTNRVLTQYAQTIGNGTLTSFVITHNLGTRDVTVQIYDAAGNFEQRWATIRRTSTTSVTIEFATAPTTDQFRVVVQGRPD